MKLIQRIAYYSGGFIIGVLLLLFFLGGKKASCDYGPNARTLKNIRSKEQIIIPKVSSKLRSQQLDTSDIAEILLKGNVRFSESNTSLDSCKIYVVQGDKDLERIKLYVENCEKKATIVNIEFSN